MEKVTNSVFFFGSCSPFSPLSLLICHLCSAFMTTQRNVCSLRQSCRSTVNLWRTWCVFLLVCVHICWLFPVWTADCLLWSWLRSTLCLVFYTVSNKALFAKGVCLETVSPVWNEENNSNTSCCNFIAFWYEKKTVISHLLPLPDRLLLLI